MSLIKFDFETRSRISIKDVDAFRYSKDESTSILCYAWKVQGENEVKALWHDEPLPAFCFDPTTTIKAHNSFFEFCIWNNVFVKLGAVPLPLENFFCTAAKAAYHALPRKLLDAGKALYLKTLKDMQGKKIMDMLSRPKADGTFHEANSYEKALLMEYCKDDVRAEDAIDESIRDLPAKEREYFLLDQKINLRGVPIERGTVNAAIQLIEGEKEKANKRINEITGGKIQTLGQRDKLLEYLGTLGANSPTLQKADVENFLSQKDLNPIAREILNLRSSLSMSSVTKYYTLKEMLLEDDNYVRGLILYYGATTGRFSGKHFQPHNLPRGSVKDYEGLNEAIKTGNPDLIKAIYGDVLKALSSGIRGTICAPEGMILRCADFSAIEARKVFWLAGCKAGLDIYNRNGKVYEEMAAEIYNTTPDKILQGSLQRQLGKQAILGCGFGMGPEKFLKTCLSYGINIDKEMAKQAVDTYRTKFFEVKNFWYSTEAAALEAYRTKRNVKNGKTVWGCDDRFLYCRLPSGRVLHFPFPSTQLKKTPWGEMKECLTMMGMNSKTRQWERYHTYGGMLVENIVQATARDTMVEAMVRVENKGYPVILTVHDEIISMTKQNHGSLHEFISLMKERPLWALDCPIDAEGFECRRYHK